MTSDIKQKGTLYLSWKLEYVHCISMKITQALNSTIKSMLIITTIKGLLKSIYSVCPLGVCRVFKHNSFCTRFHFNYEIIGTDISVPGFQNISWVCYFCTRHFHKSYIFKSSFLPVWISNRICSSMNKTVFLHLHLQNQ